MNEDPVKIRVHPLLVKELQLRKEILEKKSKYKIYGGLPMVSKICALELRKRRLKEKGIIEVHLQKRIGEKKSDVFIM